MKVQRTHDSFYLKEDWRANPKEYFKFVASLTQNRFSEIRDLDILDVGCANGDFLWYMMAKQGCTRCSGIDVSDALVCESANRVPAANISKGNIYTGEGLPDKQFDVVYLLSVHMIFDNHIPWIDNLLRLCRRGGMIYVFGMFNPDPIDVMVKAKRSGAEDVWEAGWNVVSCHTITDYLCRRVNWFRFIRWEIPVDIPRHEGDSLRGWTEMMQDGTRMIINGTCVRQYTYFLEIKP